MTQHLSITQLARELVNQHLTQGDTAIDATLGNGHDCAFLCQIVGDLGRVYAFEIQPEAIQRSTDKLHQEKLDKCLILCAASHEYMQNNIDAAHVGQVNAIMFNLGYLPNGNKTITTHPNSTLSALKQALTLISKDGIITIAVYRGHDGGQEEFNAVANFISDLQSAQYQCRSYDTPGPILYTIEKTIS